TQGAANQFTPDVAGTYVVLVSATDSVGQSSNPQSINIQVQRATPTVTVSDPGGTYNGNSFAVTATVTGVKGVAVASLEGVTPTLTSYVGNSASGTGSSTAPTNAGTYTVVASFAGSADYLSAVSDPVTFTIKKASPSISTTPGGNVVAGSGGKLTDSA